MDGFSVNGNRQEPQLIIEDVIGEDFESACFIALSGRGDYNITANSIYGCKLYKTKEECKFKGGEK